MTELATRMHGVLKLVDKKALQLGRKIQVVAATKGVWDERLAAASEAGVKTFGENYAQDFVRKAQSMDYLPVHWHFIGHLQRNKVRHVVGLAELIHSVDSLELAEHIHRVGFKRGSTQNILLQVNIDEDPNKGGIAPGALMGLARELEALNHLALKGLMVLPEQSDPEGRRASFKRAFGLFQELQAKLGPQIQTLSMGMSDDWEIAAEEGSNLVRLGTILFGSRNAQKA